MYNLTIMCKSVWICVKTVPVGQARDTPNGKSINSKNLPSVLTQNYAQVFLRSYHFECPRKQFAKNLKQGYFLVNCIKLELSAIFVPSGSNITFQWP